MVNLPNITLVIITTKDYGESIQALQNTLEKINPERTIFFTDIDICIAGAEVINVQIKNWKQYNEWIIKELYKHINTSHILLIQHDGYVLDETVWTNDFLNFDYIGAKWTYKDNRNVGNGGFSLRSKRLMEIVATDPVIEIHTPEDEIIGRLYRTYLENKHGIKYADEKTADKFSFECHKPIAPTFGFHGYHFDPYKKHILLKRTGAGGDVIMLEPIMEYYHKKRYIVVLDTALQFYNYFVNHHYQVKHISHIDHRIKYERVINFDMAYEVMPKQLVLESYANVSGISDLKLRNSKLNFKVNADNRFFKKYVLIHADTTSIPHRDIHGLDWKPVVEYLKSEGYLVFQVGRNFTNPIADVISTPNEQFLMWVVGGADFVIGIDSGVCQVAVSLGVPAVIFFGSVNPEYRYVDMKRIKVIQNECPIEKDGCYHTTIGIRGVDCEVNKRTPPCITHTSDTVIKHITDFIKSGFVTSIMDRKNIKKVAFNVLGNLVRKPSYKSNQTFLGFKPGKWIHKNGQYHHEDQKNAMVSFDVIKKRTDIFKLVEE